MSNISLTVLAAKTVLYFAMRDSHLSNVSLAKKLGCDEKEVRRLLNPNHNSKIDRLEKALKILGKKLIISIKDIE